LLLLALAVVITSILLIVFGPDAAPLTSIGARPVVSASCCSIKENFTLRPSPALSPPRSSRFSV
jgi:hypothetical protein